MHTYLKVSIKRGYVIMIREGVNGIMKNNAQQSKPNEIIEERDLFGEIFNFRNVLLCTIFLGTVLVALNYFN